METKTTEPTPDELLSDLRTQLVHPKGNAEFEHVFQRLDAVCRAGNLPEAWHGKVITKTLGQANRIAALEVKLADVRGQLIAAKVICEQTEKIEEDRQTWKRKVRELGADLAEARKQGKVNADIIHTAALQMNADVKEHLATVTAERNRWKANFDARCKQAQKDEAKLRAVVEAALAVRDNVVKQGIRFPDWAELDDALSALNPKEQESKPRDRRVWPLVELNTLTVQRLAKYGFTDKNPWLEQDQQAVVDACATLNPKEPTDG
jgi:hypothetical protein